MEAESSSSTPDSANLSERTQMSLLVRLNIAFTWRKEITVEPILFLFNIASYVVWITSQDLMVQKTCSVNFGYPDWICDNLRDHEIQEVAIQSKVSNFLMWKSILEASIKVVTVPLLGWWGDYWGRKGPLILCLSALGLESALLLVNSLATSWPLEAILCSSFIYGLSGGTHGLLMLAFSFMAQRTSTERRTLRMGILDGFYYLGSPVGLALGPTLFKFAGYAGVFGTAVGIYALTVIYVLVRISNERHRSNDEDQIQNANGCATCGVDRFTDAFQTTLKFRPERARTYILISIFAMLLDSFVIWGEGNVKYLFAQKSLNWEYSKYSYFSSISSFFTVIGALVILPIITLSTSWSDSIIGLIGAVSRSSSRLFYAFATNPSLEWLMYIGCVFGIASPLAPISIRSLISKLAFEDVGQVYSVMAVGETLLPFGSAPVYNRLYQSTLDVYPGAFYLLSFSLNFLMGLCFLYIFIMKKYGRRQDEIGPVEVNEAFSEERMSE